MARWVLPTPGGPSRMTLRPSERKRPVASSSIRVLSREGWKVKSVGQALEVGSAAKRRLVSMARALRGRCP